MKKIIFSLLLLLICEFGFNQANLHFKRLSVDQGLSQTSVSCILQDKRGYIWITTYDGLNRYDGYNFKIYRHEPNNPNSLAASRVLFMKADEDGSIWVSTIKGISHYDPFTDKFKNYLPDKNDSTAVPFCQTYLGFINGYRNEIWITGESGLFVLDKKKDVSKLVAPPVVDSVSAKDSKCTSLIRFGSKLWCSASKFSFTVDLKTHKTELTTGPPTGGKFFSPTGEKLYFCHDEKIYLIDTLSGNFLPLRITNRSISNREQLVLQLTNGTLYDVKNYTWLAGIPFILTDSTATIVEHTQDDFWIYAAWGFCADRTGNIWAGFEDRALFTDNYYNTKFRRYKFPNPLSPTDPVNAVWSITEESDSVIWITCQYATYRLNLTNGVAKCFSALNANETGFPGNISLSAVKSSDGNMWIGTKGCLNKYNPETGTFKNIAHNPNDSTTVPFRSYSAMLQTRDGKIWMAAWGIGILEFDPENEKVTRLVKYQNDVKDALHGDVAWTIKETNDGALWVGTRMGLCRYDRTSGKAENYFNAEDERMMIMHICIIDDRTFWMATSDQGFFKFDFIDRKVISQYTTADGLSNDCVYRIEPDHEGNLWLSTNYGISKFNIEKETFENFTLNDGLLNNEFNNGASHRMRNGTILFGSSDGITLFHPDKMEKNPFPPSVVIQNIKLHNKNVQIEEREPFSEVDTLSPVQIKSVNDDYTIPFDISFVKELQLDYTQNFVTLEFVALHYARPEKNEYAYMLEGLETEWNYVGDRRYASYTDLKPGEYTFLYKASNSDGIWCEPNALKIIVYPPFWQTWWFRAIGVLMLILLIWIIFKWRTQSLEKRKKELEETVVERTAEIVFQKEIIEEKHKEITDSINYAERIQRSFLATKNLLDQNLSDYFIFFNPKEAVSGDFYWGKTIANGNFSLVAADSTGHGVPGAIMSILNISAIEKAVESGITHAGDILNFSRTEIINRLKNDGSEEGGKDGMDCALLILDRDKLTLEFALANNPLWLIRNGELIEYKGEKMPVGKHDKQNQPFTRSQINLQKNDVIYIFTDGFADQFGGEKHTNSTLGKQGKKFKYSNLKKLFLSVSEKEMKLQKSIIDDTFRKWKGDIEQTDDVCIIGIRI